jgi:hypothetical protein
MLVGLGRFLTLLASLSVPVFTCHLSVPHPNAAEADTSSTAAPKIARHIIIPRSGYFSEIPSRRRTWEAKLFGQHRLTEVWGPGGAASDYPYADWRGSAGGWGTP